MGKGTDRLKMVLAFAAVYIIWGSTYLAIRYAIESMPPLLMAAARFIVAGVLFMVFARLSGIRFPTRLEWRDNLLVGTLMLAVGTGGVTWGEQWVPSGLAALLIAAMPMWMVLIDWLRPNGVRPGLPVVLGLVVGFAGVTLLLDTDLGFERGYIVGAVATVGAAFFWALGSIISRHTHNPESQIMATGLKMLLGGMSLTAFSWFAGEWPAFSISAVSTVSFLAWLYLVTFGSVAFVAYLWLLKHSTPAKAATYAFVNPAVAVLLGTLLASEPFSMRTGVASLIIIVAVLIIVMYRQKSEPVIARDHPVERPSVVRDADPEAA